MSKKATKKAPKRPAKGPAKQYSRNDREVLTKWEYVNVVELQKDGTYKWVPK